MLTITEDIRQSGCVVQQYDCQMRMVRVVVIRAGDGKFRAQQTFEWWSRVVAVLKDGTKVSAMQRNINNWLWEILDQHYPNLLNR